MSDMVQLAVPVPDLPTAEVSSLKEFASTFLIIDQSTADIAAAERNRMRDLIKAIEAERLAIKRPFMQALQLLDARFAAATDPLKQAVRMLDTALTRYIEAEELREREAAASAREAARVEQERIAKEAAQREQQAREEAERLRKAAQAEQAHGDSATASELERMATQAELAGQQDAQQMLEQSTVPIPIATARAPSGITSRRGWEWEGIDLMETVKAVADGRAPLKVLTWNGPLLQKMASALGEEFAVPGCKVNPSRTIAKRGLR
jgi:chemotaxis protein histidine kinase CheA